MQDEGQTGIKVDLLRMRITALAILMKGIDFCTIVGLCYHGPQFIFPTYYRSSMRALLQGIMVCRRYIGD